MQVNQWARTGDMYCKMRRERKVVIRVKYKGEILREILTHLATFPPYNCLPMELLCSYLAYSTCILEKTPPCLQHKRNIILGVMPQTCKINTHILSMPINAVCLYTHVHTHVPHAPKRAHTCYHFFNINCCHSKQNA